MRVSGKNNHWTSVSGTYSGTKDVQACCVFKRAVKAAEVTKLVQETLGGDKKKKMFTI